MSERRRGYQQFTNPLPPNPHPPGGLRPPERSASLELHQGLRSALLPPVQIHLNSPVLLSKEWGVPHFDIVSSSYERTSIIVTTNLPFENWTEVLGSERLTGAVLDRLTHRCHIIETKGESYRLKDARRRNTEKINTQEK